MFAPSAYDNESISPSSEPMVTMLLPPPQQATDIAALTSTAPRKIFFIVSNLF